VGSHFGLIHNQLPGTPNEIKSEWPKSSPICRRFSRRTCSGSKNLPLGLRALLASFLSRGEPGARLKPRPVFVDACGAVQFEPAKRRRREGP